MSLSFPRQLLTLFRPWWSNQTRGRGVAGAFAVFAHELWAFLRDSTPARRRQRYGDMEYDWEHRVNTTTGTIQWRERLLGMFLTAYQPSDPADFREMMAALPIHFPDFTFLDLGSGKGRTLLLASEYPFARIIGVEILPELHRVAEENIAKYCASVHPGAKMESVCLNACDFVFPPTPLLVYLFNPLPQLALLRVLQNLEESLVRSPREVWVLYYNPLLESTLSASKHLERVGGGERYSLYRART